MSASFEYTLFQMGEDPSADELSQMLVRFCMMDRVDKSVISGLVNALHALRQEEAEQEAEDDQDAEVTVLDDPEKEFRRAYKEVCEQEGHYYDEEQPNWEDHWPLDCNWHQTEIHRLARLHVGWGEVFRRQCREMMEARKGLIP